MNAVARALLKFQMLTLIQNIFILDLTPGFNVLGKTRRETFKFWVLALIL